MKHYKQIYQYSALEINGVLNDLRKEYDIVRIVDVEECRILEVAADGVLHYGAQCFKIWNRETRCANCTSYRACMTHCEADKREKLGRDRESIHSIPIYLEMLNGELEMCVIECVRFIDSDPASETENAEAGEAIATHDVLTRLYTQEKFFRETRQRLIDHPDTDYVLAIGNIRNFKLINKLFGIEGGNRVLVGIADILRSECGPEEVYGRYRDDRFALLIQKDKFHEIDFSNHLQKVRELVESPIFTLQVKLGAYEIEDKNLPVATMLSHADLAVNSIRNSRCALIAHYRPALLERQMRDQHIITDFEHALSHDEFQVYLQPQVRSDGMILGAEALVRWVLPHGKILHPSEFLGVLHQSELLSHLDAFVWERAAQMLSRWNDTPLAPLYVSINVDPSDFYYIDVPRLLSGLCKKYGIAPQRLRVEITETVLFDDITRQSSLVEKLHSQGFLVEIDDFGKGFSSLSLLKDIHADVLKIDMGFLQGESNTQRSNVILGSVIDMANHLQMGVITEGVENREQVNNLVSLGCSLFQGFYYSQPLPMKDFELLARENISQFAADR